MTQKKKPPEAAKKAKEYLADLQRLQAEFDNYKKRTERERLASANRASLDLIRRLIPVMDDLDRAIGAAAQDEAAARFTEGVEEIDAFGQLFDPNLHEAIMQEPSAEHADEHVTEVLRKGYILGDQVIRPSMVKIANNDG
jgi:molecular chaperone GrpE